ncbi:hypothetical protein DO65_3574 [Burkholderia pseudomallei]|nr:hypothetical protein DO73_2160 [Burkholderia pseudomallei]KGC51278.1 hypothetical protein DO65_3574 [Burkholderia pseudomallei]
MRGCAETATRSSSRASARRARVADRIVARLFYVTDRYVGWPIVLVRLSAAQPDMVKALPLRAWRAKVPAKWRDAAA